MHGALAWRRLHGPVELATDSLGAAWFREQGLDVLYDRIDTDLDELDDLALDPVVYFTGGKYLAVRRRTAPFALLDLDLYLRRPLPGLDGKGFVFAHWESVGNAVYPEPAELLGRSGADLGGMRFDTPATNMAVAAFLDEEHRAAFAEAALGYALANGGPAPLHPVARAAFAEQRLAPAVARRLGTPLRPAGDGFWLVEEERWDGPAPVELFHHTWNLKAVLRNVPDLRAGYTRQLIEELLWRHPESLDLLLRVPALAALAPVVRAVADGLERHGPLTAHGAAAPPGR
ncbi:hypothetical protein [Streptacidiphilus jiangxiensis]|uniref:hypothetical protein n=1 Tax=Streptacidiphilus jiangxiensis TaxID=235985 RepID=UPI000AB47871|nr:hypothetical protein [Streptacidiphilus jiangxiensis]